MLAWRCRFSSSPVLAEITVSSMGNAQFVTSDRSGGFRRRIHVRRYSAMQRDWRESFTSTSHSTSADHRSVE
jgi:hypothetical protein